MKKKTIITKQSEAIPPNLTEDEHAELNRYMHLKDWHFEVLFIKSEHITLIEEFTINYSSFKKAQLYGLKAIVEETNQATIANFFLRCDNEVYQSTDIEGIMETIAILRKWEERHDYEQNRQKGEKKQLKVA